MRRSVVVMVLVLGAAALLAEGAVAGGRHRPPPPRHRTSFHFGFRYGPPMGYHHYAPCYYGYRGGFHGFYSPPWPAYAPGYWVAPPPPVYGGKVRIEGEPKELRASTYVYVDGSPVGVVDDFDGYAQRLDLPAGEVDIRLELEGFQPAQRHVVIVPGRTVKLRYELEPGESPSAPRPRPADASWMEIDLR